MTTVSTPHSANQSTNRCRSAVKVPKLHTGSGARSALTAAMCMVAPMSMAAAFGCTTGIVRSILVFHFLRFISTPPADIAEGLSCAIDQIPKRDRRCGVTTLKSATAHGPGFLTGLHATKIVSAAPFRTQSIANPFLSHRGRAAPRSVFLKASVAFLRNGSTSFRLQGLQNKAECLGTSVQIVDHSRTVACLVGRGPRIDVIHPVTHSVVEQDCDLAGRCGDCLGLADAGRASSVKGAERSVGASDC